MLWIILAIIVFIHIVVMTFSYLMGKAAGESSWGLWILLCLIPIFGPVFACYLYALILAEKSDNSVK